jgi:hypothetical protein
LFQVGTLYKDEKTTTIAITTTAAATTTTTTTNNNNNNNELQLSPRSRYIFSIDGRVAQPQSIA